MDVSHRINELMEDRGWTAYRLAKESHLAPAQIHQYVTGKRIPSVEVIERICAGFGISLSDFFASAEETPCDQVLDLYFALDPERKALVLQLLQALSDPYK